MVNQPKVSVVVPAYNAQRTVRDCAESILALDWPKDMLEAVFVDDGSTDDTRKLIASYKEVKLIEAKHGGPAAARNLGVKNSTGDVIVFTDSDCIVPKDWLVKFAAELGSADAVGGGIAPASLGSFAERFEQRRRDRLYGNRRRYADALPSCNLAFKRKAFEDAGGFDEEFKRASAEDYDLCRRVTAKGYRILYEPRIEVIHRHSQTVDGILKRAFLHGTEMMRLRRKMGKSMATELAKTAVKALATPILVLTRYSPAMMPLGLAYETLSLAGNINGILKQTLRA